MTSFLFCCNSPTHFSLENISFHLILFFRCVVFVQGYHCNLTLNRIEVEFNDKYNIVIINQTKSDDPHVILLNVFSEVLVEIQQIKSYFRICIPEDQNDQNYRKIFLNTVVDVGKFLKGSNSNLLVRYAIDVIAKASNFELKLPIKKVRF